MTALEQAAKTYIDTRRAKLTAKAATFPASPLARNTASTDSRLAATG